MRSWEDARQCSMTRVLAGLACSSSLPAGCLDLSFPLRMVERRIVNLMAFIMPAHLL